MKKHVKTYLDHFEYDLHDFIECEIPGCRRKAVDIHHIHARGMGGSKERDNIENLMALCREHHEHFGDKTKYRTFLINIHKDLLEK